MVRFRAPIAEGPGQSNAWGMLAMVLSRREGIHSYLSVALRPVHIQSEVVLILCTHVFLRTMDLFFSSRTRTRVRTYGKKIPGTWYLVFTGDSFVLHPNGTFVCLLFTRLKRYVHPARIHPVKLCVWYDTNCTYS